MLLELLQSFVVVGGTDEVKAAVIKAANLVEAIDVKVATMVEIDTSTWLG